MKGELAYIADIVRSKEAVAAGDALLNALRSTFSLTFAQLLVFSADGHLLVSHDGLGETNWPVMDFGAPFAHVLQSGEEKILSADELI
ncbi:hypothetical protein P3584_26565, partial [Vibrio parahaemolyticus]|nr:hypothetical protein [Vibrio parahaemolyticus]